MQRVRSVRLETWLGVCLLGLLVHPHRAGADSPSPPPARYSRCSSSGAFCFTSDPAAGTSVHTSTAPETSLWRLPSWYRVAFVSNDGEHLVVGFDGVNLVPLGDPEGSTIVQFWRRTELVKAYTLGELGYRRESLHRTASHYAWGRYDGFDSNGGFRLTMIDGVSLVFDPRSGELIRRVEPGPKGSAGSGE